MLKFFVRRLLEALFLLFGIVSLVFFIVRLLPGDATAAYLSPTIPPEVVEQLKEQLGLDRPLMEQYLHWLGSACTGNLGVSLTRNAPVSEVIGQVVPNTIVLGVASLVVEIILGVCFAAMFFYFRGGKAEAVLSRTTLVVYSLPSFWIGMLLLMMFSYSTGWFPSSHMYSSGEHTIADLLGHIVLPAFTAAIPAAAGFARYLRGSIHNVLKQEYILASHAMGLTRSRIFRSYVLPNAVSPIIALLGVEIGILFGGVLVTEYMFSWPGIGRMTVIAIGGRDYPLILGCTLVVGAMVIIGNMLADIINAILDPRIWLTE